MSPVAGGKRVIAIIGGTGPEGRGLALRFAAAGESVIIGSRSAERGRAAAQKVRAALPHADVRGADNRSAAREGEIIVVTVPYEGQRPTLEALREESRGKVVITTVVPLAVTKAGVAVLGVDEGSAAEQAQTLLPEAGVAAAFQTVSATQLAALERPVEADVIACSDDAVARDTAIALAEAIPGVRALDGGPLRNARYLEHMTALLLVLGRRYRAHPSVRFTGIDK
ncbi:MAG: NADPH-dependent F420 reductase [Dehalococcoidia bacterium]|nr:NADPH-dependent F420 reductase [Dehalococcoidia bacterium]